MYSSCNKVAHDKVFCSKELTCVFNVSDFIDHLPPYYTDITNRLRFYDIC